jgi:hypothetical protein
MTISFKGQQVSFWIRLIKKLGPIVLVLGFLFFKVKYGKTFSGDLGEYKIYFYIFGIICFLIGIYYHIRDIRTVVTEVRFIDDKFQVLGLDFNSKFEDTLKIDQTSLEIKEKEKSKQLYIEIFSNDKYYYINNYSDWKKVTLVELINEYRNRSERTIYGIELFPELIKTEK